MENKSFTNAEYIAGGYHKETTICKEDDDFWIFWSKRRFLHYFVDGVRERHPLPEETDQ
ncbi:MAG: hypothetical protein RSB93_02110 [Rikenellaceae bacterium]